ncbi:MAG: hypothetical protein ACPGUY_05625 [Akkermansiaceae bacterium]
MTDRLLVFSNPEVQKLLKEKFIPVAANDWYQRRRQDAEGEFFRSVANQGPRKGQGGGTRQGHYVLSASGTLLGYNNNRGPARRLKMMRNALSLWNDLPAKAKKPTIPEIGKADPKFQRLLPSGGQVIKAYTRCLEMRDGKLMAMGGEKVGKLAAVDHLWLQKGEIKQLHQLQKGGGGPLPARIRARILRFHLTDSTRGEPPHWAVGDMKMAMIQMNSKGELAGGFSLMSDGKDGQKRSYSGTIFGHLLFTAEGKLAKFELLATGEHEGEGRFTKGARPDPSPLAVYFTLSDGKKAADQIPPQGMHWERGYWQAEKK